MVWPAGHKVKNGRYVIQEVLGQGGFGITYKAWDNSQNGFVALKTPNEYLKHDPDYQKYVSQFVKESKRLQRLTKLSHPHIVKFGEFFQEGDTYCLLMEYVAGKNFFEIVKEKGKLPEKETVEYIRQVASALAAIHQTGLVHRDAQPGNIILRGDKAVLIDFGIAKELVPTTISSTGNAGNRGFAPYEQMMKGSREINADVYCLAATLYYLVTGQRPTSSFARKIDNANLIPPRKLVLEISKDLNNAIIKGMELEAKKRPQSVEEWLDLLEVQKQRNQKVIPWVWLGLLLAVYVFIGVIFLSVSPSYVICMLAVAGALAGAWNIDEAVVVAVALVVMGAVALGVVLPVMGAVAVVGAVAVALAVDEFWARALAVVVAVVWVMALAVAGAIAMAGTTAIAMAVAMAVAVAGTVVGAVVGAGAMYELDRYFSRVHVFLILVITSLLGLGLGGLLGLAL